MAVLLPSCSRAFDAQVYNPCQESAIVTFSNRRLSVADSEWRRQVTVLPVSALRVDGVFSDADADGTGFIRVEIGEAPARIFEVPYLSEEPFPAMIPASAC